MHRYQILMEYVGTNFYGWQYQKKQITIQGTVEKILKKILKEKVKLYGSGRTDSKVHAIEQSAHFDVKNKINNISYGGLLQATYISSEFAKIRASLSHEFDREEGITTSKDTRFELQLFFVIGSHPAHAF